MALLVLVLLLCTYATKLLADHAAIPRGVSITNLAAENGWEQAATWKEASWPPATVGTPVRPQEPDAELRAMLARVDPARIQANILKLVQFGTRHTLSIQNSTTRGIGAARDWIAAEMRTYAAAANGSMAVEVHGYLQGVMDRVPFPVRISNVFATLQGTAKDGRVYVISGHYDSRVTDANNYSDDAPGANDDASGVAGRFILFTAIDELAFFPLPHFWYPFR